MLAPQASVRKWTTTEVNNLIRTIETTKGWNLSEFYQNDVSEVVTNSNKENIVRDFKTMILKVYANDEKAASFKAREYSDTIKAIGEFDGEIDSLETAEKVLKAYGKKNPAKTLKKIKEIIDTGVLSTAEKARQNPLVQAVSNLTQIYAIGNKKAISLYNDFGIITIQQLKEKFKEDQSILHNKQKIGLRYFDDLQERIPRSEMIEYEKVLIAIAKKVDPTIQLSINGSYRRKLESSGDIDVLITSTTNPSESRKKLITELMKQGILIETLANGAKKFMGVSKLPGYLTHRHMDIIDSSLESYAFGILYFTGSGGFNAMMRGKALEQGYSLNEYRLSHKKTKKPLTSDEIAQKIGKSRFETEMDIFQFLNMDYVEPENRANVTLSKVIG